MDLWSLLRIVSQRSLRSCRLEFEDRPVERASLFPLFDGDGRTRMVMITAEEDTRIMLADWAAGVFVREWTMRNRVRLRFADLRDASMVDEARFETLWHFDPWWVLGDERYQGHGVVPALRNTNIPGHDPAVSNVLFDSSLARATYVVRRSANGSVVRRFTSDTLAAFARLRAAQQPPRGVDAAGWRLRPSWRST